MKILLSDKLSEKGIKILENEDDIEVDLKSDLTPEELVKCIKNYDAMIIRSTTTVTTELLEAASKLKVIGRAGVGVDNVDVDTATRLGILVANTPSSNTIAAVEHTITLMLALSRNVPQANISLKSGVWARAKFVGVELFNKILGVVGLGRIGSEVVKRVKAFGMKAIAYDPYTSKEGAEKIGVKLVSFEELLAQADYISLHVPYLPQTHHLIGRKEFELMKPETRLVNCARGGVIDEFALYYALKNKMIAGAALDVFESEPLTDSPLFELDNAIVTPHLGAATKEAQANVATEIAKQVINALRGLPVTSAINQISIDPDKVELLSPYLKLAEKIGSFQAQILDRPIVEVHVKYRLSDLVDEPMAPITVALQKGLLTPGLQDSVNFVNAPFLIKQRGIKITETKESISHDFANLIAVTVKTDKRESTIAGTIFGKNDPRIVQIDDYHINAVPLGYVILLYNKDQPGMIGVVGTILGENGINIADMSVGRTSSSDRSLMVINIDSLVPKELLQEICDIENIFNARQLMLY